MFLGDMFFALSRGKKRSERLGEKSIDERGRLGYKSCASIWETVTGRFLNSSDGYLNVRNVRISAGM